MLWILKRNIISDKAAAIFNAWTNYGNSSNSSSGSGSSSGTSGCNKNKSSVSKKVAYNKLASQDDGSLNGNVASPSGLSSKFSCLGDSGNCSDYEDELTDDSDYDESLTCNVCDRSFYNRRSLEQHQQKKRHFGCSACDTLFQTIMQLEHHKEEFEHWSDSETSALTCQHHAGEDEDCLDDDSGPESTEEMERLL